MADSSKIEWTDATWNPITGCTLVSEGCRNCYAAQLAATRLKNHLSREGLATLNADGVAKFNGTVRFNEEWLDQPLRWKKPRMVFVCAHGDLFHEAVPDEWIDQVFAVMSQCPHHTFQVLTKRPERMRDYLTTPLWQHKIVAAAVSLKSDRIPVHAVWPHPPLPNVWLGVSVEDQVAADARIPNLLATPAAVRFISAEPLLGPMDLRKVNARPWDKEPGGQQWTDALTGMTNIWVESRQGGWGGVAPGKINWVIVGGESGANARPMHPDWALDLRDQCAAADVPFFFKQWGAWKAITQMEEAEWQRLYVSKKKAKAHEDQDVLDDVWGRRCMVDEMCLMRDGNHCDPLATDAWCGNGAMMGWNIGKTAAGRLLDGSEHSAMPAREVPAG